MRRRDPKLAFGLCAIGIALITPAPAAAQTDDGVFLDPESPAGKEYEIPFESARRRAAGGPVGSGGSRSGRGGGPVDALTAGVAPLFGVGITASGESGSDEGSGGSNGTDDEGGASGSGRGGDGGPGSAGQGIGGRDGGGPTGGRRGDPLVAAAASDSSGGRWVGGIVGAVLAGGLLLGFGLRRLRGRGLAP